MVIKSTMPLQDEKTKTIQGTPLSPVINGIITHSFMTLMIGFHWGYTSYNHYKWRYFTAFITGKGAPPCPVVFSQEKTQPCCHSSHRCP